MRVEKIHFYACEVIKDLAFMYLEAPGGSVPTKWRSKPTKRKRRDQARAPIQEADQKVTPGSLRENCQFRKGGGAWVPQQRRLPGEKNETDWIPGVCVLFVFLFVFTALSESLGEK